MNVEGIWNPANSVDWAESDDTIACRPSDIDDCFRNRAIRISIENSKEWLHELPSLKGLKKLSCTFGYITQKHLAGMSTLSTLSHLRLGNLTAKALDPLANLRQLTELTIARVPSKASLKPAFELPHLQSLVIGLAGDEKSLNDLTDVDNRALRNLCLFQPSGAKTVVVPSLRPLQSLKCLHNLHLSSIRPADSDITAVCGIKSLRALRLSKYLKWDKSQISKIEAAGVSVVLE